MFCYFFVFILQQIGCSLIDNLVNVDELSRNQIERICNWSKRIHGRRWNDGFEDGILDPLDLFLQESDLDLEIVVTFSLLFLLRLQNLQFSLPILTTPL